MKNEKKKKKKEKSSTEISTWTTDPVFNRFSVFRGLPRRETMHKFKALKTPHSMLVE